MNAAQPCRLPLTGGIAGATVKLHPLLCGQFKGPPRWFLGPPGITGVLQAFGVGVPSKRLLDVPIVAFLVEHPGAGPFLVDTGLHSSIAKEGIGKHFGRASTVIYRDLKMRPEQAVRAQLRARGHDPNTVSLILMTHLHADHASAIREFPKSTVVVSKREWNDMGGSLAGYRSAQLKGDIEYRLLDFDGEGVPAEGFNRTVDLFGDGSVRAVHTPGHSPGHISLILRLADRQALLAGDAIFTINSLRGNARPWLVQDAASYRDSLTQLKRFDANHPSALIIPGHDMQTWNTLSSVY
jgi:N-acyl homoserine lactone hydrolase